MSKQPRSALEGRRRVLFVTWGFDPGPVGGAERQARLQAEELTRLGYSVDVVCPREAGVPARYRLGTVQVRRLRRANGRLVRRITYFLNLFVFIVAHAREYDLIHVHLANVQADVAVLAAWLRNCPSWVKVACGGPDGEIRRMNRVASITRRYGLRRASRVQAISNQIRGELIEQVGVNPQRIVEIPNGVAVAEFYPTGPEAKERIRRELDLPITNTLVLYLGRLAEYKGLDKLAAAWERVSAVEKDAYLVVVGPLAEDAPVDMQIFEVPNVIVRPKTSRPVDYLHAADLVVNPSRSDGMANSLLEAMSCGLPIIASRAGAAPEMLAGGAGCLMEGRDPEELASAICELIGSPDLREALGSAARAKALTYDIASIGIAIAGEYATISPQLDSGKVFPSGDQDVDAREAPLRPGRWKAPSRDY